MTLDEAMKMTTPDGIQLGELPGDKLVTVAINDQYPDLAYAACMILDARDKGS